MAAKTLGFPSGQRQPASAVGGPIGLAALRGQRGPLAQADGDGGGKMDAQSAGYMELDGAQKDADCEIVQVEGGVSSDLGCCNEYEPQDGAQQFKCGSCVHLEKDDNEQAETGGQTSSQQTQAAGSPSVESATGGYA